MLRYAVLRCPTSPLFMQSQTKTDGVRKALRWLIVLIVTLAVLAIALFATARLRGPSKEQKAALAVLAMPQPTPGRNAFPLVWLLPYDVPPAEYDRVVAEDLRRFANASPLMRSDEATATFTSAATTRYPAPERDRSRYCHWREPGCLTKVRTEPDAYAEMLRADAALLDRADSISDYGHFRSPFPPRLDMPFPPLNLLSPPMTRYAHAFVEGNIEAGLDGACRGVSTGRMLIDKGENLISAMVGAAMLQANAELLADMLAELPSAHPLPASCSVALAPPRQDEFSLCNTIRGEARHMFGTLRQVVDSHASTDNPLLDSLQPLVYDYDKSVARIAPSLAWFCGAQARSALAADTPTQAPPIRPMAQSFECLDNVAGCVLTDISAPTFDIYQHRLQDAALRLKTTATLLWLRSHPDDQPLAERLAQRPASLRSPRREIRIEQDGRSVSVELFDRRRGARWTLPVPASRVPSAGSIGTDRKLVRH